MKLVYMINGFLESGKTEFIQYTIAQPYFQQKGKTLLIVCEDGENEYDPALLKKTNTILEMIEDREEFTSSHLIELEKKYKPERIIIEFNGMWNMKEVKLPWHWKVEQQITLIDGSTFSTYYTNMRSLLAEMIRGSELIIFNRCDGIEDLASYRRNVKAVNPKAEVVFEGSEGEIDEIFEEDLPYNLQDPVLKLDDYGYGIWFLDSCEHLERYEGKTLEFIAQVMIPKDMKKGYFVPGRMAMTCCADDMSFLGYVCQYDHVDQLENKQWVKVTAVVKKEYWEEYEGEGPVLYASKVEPVKAPKEEILSFN